MSELKKSSTGTELPTDNEILAAGRAVGYENDTSSRGYWLLDIWAEGAKWMREQIVGEQTNDHQLKVTLSFAPWAFRSQPCIKPKCRTWHQGAMYRLTSQGAGREVFACRTHLPFAVECAIADAQAVAENQNKGQRAET